MLRACFDLGNAFPRLIYWILRALINLSLLILPFLDGLIILLEGVMFDVVGLLWIGLGIEACRMIELLCTLNNFI